MVQTQWYSYTAPDDAEEDTAGWTMNFKWTNTRWEKYFDGCNEGLKQVVIIYVLVHHFHIVH